ncbi:alpha/beta hydrolase family protein [Paramagnetospirillum marisnigri]|uniref:alpha/beta hydrolase family protein n=1 Tax=Paramagnetospirillum marisnigri TaxID=1285242 RepID=UPI0012E985C3|nr:hypothetical protein [Paramagnetospirillum marisnigri]
MVCRLAGDVVICGGSSPEAITTVERTFAQELVDTQRVLAYFQREWAPHEPPRIVLIGHGGGGIVAFLAAKELPIVDTIITVGTGLSETGTDRSEGLPAKAAKRAISGFKGSFIMHQTGADDVVLPRDYDALYGAASNARNKSRHLHDGVDHALSTANAPGTSWFDEIIRDISDVLALRWKGEPRHWPPGCDP